MPPELDDDFLDGCDIDFAAEADDEETQSLRALFPRGQEDAHLESEWRALFEADPKLHELAPLTAQALTAYSGSGRDTGIADRLRAAGLKVVEIDGWKTRGSSTFSPKGSVDHHTAGGRSGNAPSLGICINGRSDLPGPLCNVLIGRDGTCYVIAAGRANHAGAGGWRGLTGNSSMFGIERENVGTTAEPWTPQQTEIAQRAHAALIRGIKNPVPELVCEHKEWAPTRKSDAHTITGATMRDGVHRFLLGPNPTPSGDDDMPEAITYPGSGAIFISNGTSKFTLGAWQEFLDCVNNGQIPKDSNGNGIVRVYSQGYVERLPETRTVADQVKYGADHAGGPAITDKQLEAFANSVVKELADAIAAGLAK